MELEVIRISSGTDSTNGVLFEIDKHSPAPHAEGFRCKREFLAYTLEDEYREENFAEVFPLLNSVLKIYD